LYIRSDTHSFVVVAAVVEAGLIVVLRLFDVVIVIESGYSCPNLR
jgi:hypothetical protein